MLLVAGTPWGDTAKNIPGLHLRTAQTTEAASVSQQRLQRIREAEIFYLPRGQINDLFFVSEPLEQAVVSFEAAAKHLEQVIRTSDLANET